MVGRGSDRERARFVETVRLTVKVEIGDGRHVGQKGVAGGVVERAVAPGEVGHRAVAGVVEHTGRLTVGDEAAAREEEIQVPVAEFPCQKEVSVTSR